MTNSRAKGKRGELALVHFLNDHGYHTRRGQQYAGINGDADVVGIDGMHIECKWVENLDIYDAMRQSQKDAKENELPVVFHKKNHQRWKASFCLGDVFPSILPENQYLVTMDAEDFLGLWEVIQ